MKMNQKIHVVIIDEQEVTRFGMRVALERDDRIAILAEGTSDEDAVQLVREHAPDILLFGLNTAASTANQSGCHALTHETIRFLVKNTNTKVLALSRYAHKGLVCSVMRAGASGFMIKDEAMNSGKELAQSIVQIAKKGKLPLSHALQEKLYPYGFDIEDIPQLTTRRIEFMQAVADNPHLTVMQIAEMLSIAESTLRNNLSAVSRALEMPHLNGAMIACVRLGVVQIGP